MSRLEKSNYGCSGCDLKSKLVIGLDEQMKELLNV